MEFEETGADALLSYANALPEECETGGSTPADGGQAQNPEKQVQPLALVSTTSVPNIQDTPTPGMDNLIQDILKTKRCHNSTGELNFVAWLYKYLHNLKVVVTTMSEGALAVTIGKKSKSLFSCHVDTVHSQTESDGSFQTLFYDENFGHIFCGDKTSGCLGADDGAGIYIMLKMIEAKVPGTYLFHRGEEKGGISAFKMVEQHSGWLGQFNFCVAFDRPNNFEVIVTQGGTTCASVDFGSTLAGMLTKAGLAYEVSHKGLFTDCKVYRHIIPECVNLGVGYWAQHSNSEYLDWTHLLALTKAAIGLEWSKLKPQKKPEAKPAVYTPPKGSYDAGWGANKNNYGAGASSKGYYEGSAGAKSADRFIRSVPVDANDLEDYLDTDFTTMRKEDIDDLTGDSSITNGIMALVCELEAEKARAKKLQFLLGIT